MNSLEAHAKINLALVVGPTRGDAKHEVVTVLQKVDLADSLAIEPSEELLVEGFVEESLVRGALVALAGRAGCEPLWHATITKRIPVAAGLGGGSSDAAAALRLANSSLPSPLPESDLHELAAQLGADVPFFLTTGPHVGTGDGTQLEPIDLPSDYSVVIVVPHGLRKDSTAAIYRDFDARGGEVGFGERSRRLRAALARVARARDLAQLPENDLAASPLAGQLERLGAFRADVSGAGPAVYGLFEHSAAAATAARELGDAGAVIVATPTR